MFLKIMIVGNKRTNYLSKDLSIISEEGKVRQRTFELVCIALVTVLILFNFQVYAWEGEGEGAVTVTVTLTLYVHDGTESGPVLSGARVIGHDAAGSSFDKTTGSGGYVTITG